MRIWTKLLNKPFSLTWEGKVEQELGVVVELELRVGVREVPVSKRIMLGHTKGFSVFFSIIALNNYNYKTA